MPEEHWPYQPPRAEVGSREPRSPAETPQVWYWYVAYCISMCLMYLVVSALGVVMLAVPDSPSMQPGDQIGVIIYGVMLILVGAAFALLYGVVLFLPKTKISWVLGFITIGIGATSACCLPACIPLFYFWIKNDTRAFFDVPTRP